MAVAPNQSKLIIPGKNSHGAHPGYDTDMRAIEIWANAQPKGGVQQLIAGTNITLSPPDGEGIVTINSTGGGGGGGTPALVTLIAEADDLLFPATFMPFSPYQNWTGVDGESHWPVWSNAGGGPVYYQIGASWMADVFGTLSANILPTFTMPAFTGGPLTISYTFWASTVDFANFATYEGVTPSLTTGETYQAVVGDLSLLSSGGADLTLTPGTGNSGNGLVSSAGGVYFAGVSGGIQIPAGTTFP